MQKEKKKGAPGMRGRDLPMGGYDWGQIFWFRFRERCIVPQNTGAFHIVEMCPTSTSSARPEFFPAKSQTFVEECSSQLHKYLVA